MKTQRDNRIILDLNKVQWARFYYRNQTSDTRDTILPLEMFSIRGEVFDRTARAFPHIDFPNETLLARARRLGMVDIWQPEVMFKVAANCCVIYTGDKALSMDKAWRAKIFKKKK